MRPLPVNAPSTPADLQPRRSCPPCDQRSADARAPTFGVRHASTSGGRSSESGARSIHYSGSPNAMPSATKAASAVVVRMRSDALASGSVPGFRPSPRDACIGASVRRPVPSGGSRSGVQPTVGCPRCGSARTWRRGSRRRMAGRCPRRRRPVTARPLPRSGRRRWAGGSLRARWAGKGRTTRTTATVFAAGETSA